MCGSGDPVTFRNVFRSRAFIVSRVGSAFVHPFTGNKATYGATERPLSVFSVTGSALFRRDAVSQKKRLPPEPHDALSASGERDGTTLPAHAACPDGIAQNGTVPFRQ